jgi:protein gp37
MGQNSGIEWTDHTFNPWMGCTKVSPACKNCYAERDFDHRYGKVKWGPNGTRVVTSDANWRKPLAWNKAAAESPVRPRVFCASLADVFEDWQGPMTTGTLGEVLAKPYLDSESGPDNWIPSWREDMESDPQGWRYVTMGDVRSRLLKLIDATPNLDWLLLTKRPENIQRMWRCKNDTNGDGDCGSCKHGLCRQRNNVWLGATVESSDYLHRIDSLKAAGRLASVLFISAEPVVGPVPTLGEYLDGIDWVITGGESGPEARPADPDWFRSIRDQCDMHSVPFHFKQWGEFNENQERVGKKNAGRLLDGEAHDGVPVLVGGR